MLKTRLIHIIISLLLTGTTMQIAAQSADEVAAFATAKATNQHWTLKNVDISLLIEQIAKVTGKNFVIDPAVKGKVTLLTNHPLSAEESYQAFLTLLKAYSFAVIDNGEVMSILPQSEANMQAKLSPDASSFDSLMVKVFHLRYIPSQVLVEAIKPLLSSNSIVQNISKSNKVIIADYNSHVVKVAQLIEEIDRADIENNVEVVTLYHAEPSEINNILTSLLTSDNENETPIRIAADERTNSILIHGNLSQRLKVRALIRKMDKPTKDIDNNTQVIYLKYIQAKDAAPIVANIIQDYESKLQEKTGKEQTQSKAAIVADRIGQETTSISAPLNNNQSGSDISTLASRASQASNLAREQENRPRSGAVTTSVQWEETTNAIIVRAPKDLLRSIKQVIAKLDIRRMQVLVEVIIAEVSLDRARELGVEWNTGGDIRVSTRFPSLGLSNITGPMGGTGTSAVLSELTDNATTEFIPGRGLTLGFFNMPNLRAIVRALDQDSASDILATPNIVTLDNETATIKVGQLVPFAIGESTENLNTGGTPFTSFQREEVGLSLTIRPQITPTGEIMLHIDHILSNVIPGTQLVNSSGNPTTSERVVTTNVIVDNEQVLVLGGLIQKEYQTKINKVPLLGDLPGVGQLFRSNEKTNTKRNLMIFIKPNILFNKRSNVVLTGERYEHLRQAQLDLKSDLKKLYRETSPTMRPLKPNKLPMPYFVATKHPDSVDIPKPYYGK